MARLINPNGLRLLIYIVFSSLPSSYCYGTYMNTDHCPKHCLEMLNHIYNRLCKGTDNKLVNHRRVGFSRKTKTIAFLYNFSNFSNSWFMEEYDLTESISSSRTRVFNLVKSPGHQHRWCRLCRIGKFSSYTMTNFNILHLVRVEKRLKVFPMKYLARKGLVKKFSLVMGAYTAMQFTHKKCRWRVTKAIFRSAKHTPANVPYLTDNPLLTRVGLCSSPARHIRCITRGIICHP